MIIISDPDVTPWCYDCDSRFDPYCADPFNKTLPPENKPAIRMCRGCCIKFLHKIPNGTGGVGKSNNIFVIVPAASQNTLAFPLTPA